LKCLFTNKHISSFLNEEVWRLNERKTNKQDLYFQMSDTTTPTVPSTSTSNRNTITGHNNHFGKYVKLNVGNHLFLTSFDTLTKEDTMFKAMFSGRMEVVQDSEGKHLRPLHILAESFYFID
jgi:hypothetical protein